MNKQLLEICILAAGLGSRMRSPGAKVLHTLAGKPLLEHLLGTVAGLQAAATHVVIGEGGEAVKAHFNGWNLNWVEQAERLGTGHAVMQAAPAVSDEARLLVCLGDTPLVRLETLQSLLQLEADLAILTVTRPDPSGYGRIVREGDRVTRIVEEKDASAEEKRIREVNSGVMAIKTSVLKPWLGRLTKDKAQGEYLLTDLVEIANQDGASVRCHATEDPIEVTGVNTFTQLSELERLFQRRQARALMDTGVQLMDPTRFDLRGKLTAGQGVKIDVNVIIEGEVTLAEGVTIGPNVVIRNAVIGQNTQIKANSMIEDAKIGANCSVGPFARLRPGASLANAVAIGNFVEVKKTHLGEGSKANHLAYLGDSTLGEGVNIGAGAVTCNYDGANKHETHIGDGAFIGSNVALVAPVNIGAGATIGAGSTITRDVDSQALALGRSRQKALLSWQRPVKPVKPGSKE